MSLCKFRSITKKCMLGEYKCGAHSNFSNYSRGSYIYTGITIQVTVVLVVIRPVYDGWLYF